MLQFIVLVQHDTSRQIPEDWQAHLDYRKLCQQAISNCQELYFLEDTTTDASDYGIGGNLYMVTNGKIRVIRFFGIALTGAQLN